ncbi:MAG: hypothetical protein RR842_02370 [Gordonibacter sp.]|uniref:type II toxin-antitoxin system RelE family toxin n=1 Tax=Gordonibacter sp. TaxID=1968902 RepID=UPI002FCA620F
MSAPHERFEVRFYNAVAAKEYQALDGSVRRLVDIGLAKLRVRADEIGKPLSGPLKMCKELKFRSAGIRVIFRIVDGVAEVVEIVAIGPRDKGNVFDVASQRLKSAGEGS